MAVDLDKVPPGHQDAPCQDPTEPNDIASLEELIASQCNEATISARDHDAIQESNAEIHVDVSHVVASTGTQITAETNEDTDNDLWSGKKSKQQKEIDNYASVRLLEILKERWTKKYRDVLCSKRLQRNLGKLA